MFWFWVGLVVVIVLTLAAWSSYRSRRVRSASGVTSPGAFGGPREGLSETETAKGWAEMNTTRPDHHPGGSF